MTKKPNILLKHFDVHLSFHRCHKNDCIQYSTAFRPSFRIKVEFQFKSHLSQLSRSNCLDSTRSILSSMFDENFMLSKQVAIRRPCILLDGGSSQASKHWSQPHQKQLDNINKTEIGHQTFLTLLELITVNALENTPSVMNLIFKLHFSIYDMNQAISMQWKWNTHY